MTRSQTASCKKTLNSDNRDSEEQDLVTGKNYMIRFCFEMSHKVDAQKRKKEMFGSTKTKWTNVNLRWAYDLK